MFDDTLKTPKFTIPKFATPKTESPNLVSPNFISYATATQEDRCGNRERVHISAHLRPSGSTGFAVVVKNLSVAGFSAEALTGMKPGSRIFITLPGLAAQQAEIVWNDGTMIGCSFQNLLNKAVFENFVRQYRYGFSHA
jgi:hypothetical protein